MRLPRAFRRWVRENDEVVRLVGIAAVLVLLAYLALKSLFAAAG